MSDFNGGVRANPKIQIEAWQRNYILSNYTIKKNIDMALHLGVSKSKVKSWLDELGIIKRRVYNNTNVANGYFKHDANLVTI